VLASWSVRAPWQCVPVLKVTIVSLESKRSQSINGCTAAPLDHKAPEGILVHIDKNISENLDTPSHKPTYVPTPLCVVVILCVCEGLRVGTFILLLGVWVSVFEKVVTIEGGQRKRERRRDQASGLVWRGVSHRLQRVHCRGGTNHGGKWEWKGAARCVCTRRE